MFFSLPSLLLLLSGCATQGGGPVTITKVNPYHLQTGSIAKTADEMVEFESRRFLYGAVDSEDHKERWGNYFSIFWKSETKAPATVRLEYRQGGTGPAIHRKETFVPEPGRRNVTKFEVTGDEYRKKGKVTQWKASIVENDEVVAEYKSFLWQQ
ncbi:MAG: hypothetical protein WD342_18865 [Verrucomicrobiales bacterium]